jgi:Transposase DDE domain
MLVDELAQPVLARLPLAEAVLLVWRWIADAAFLQQLFQRFRGRSYEKIIGFPLVVQLIADALLERGGSANKSFEQAIENDDLQASVQAAYGKLRRLPIPLSMAFLSGCTDRLRALFPTLATTAPPASLAGLAVVVYDGKAIKRVAKRLKKLRGVPGGLLGGRALVAMTLSDGLTVAMHAHPDGDANDVRFVGDLLPEVRQRIAGPRLHLADRQFCDLVQMTAFTAEADDHFLIRYHAKVHFHRDPSRPERTGTDAAGRPYTEAWGWLGSASHKLRRYVRQITLERPDEEAIILVTDLLDADRYAATDLLSLYLARWGIERMFQKVTEVFGLQELIGGTPQATIFQFAFCMVLYNLIQVVRGYVAQAEQRAIETISTEKLFEDVTEQLMALNTLIDTKTIVDLFAEPPALAEMQKRLQTLLADVWQDRWLKAPSRKRNPQAKKGKRTHGSVYRILTDYRGSKRRRRQE